MRHSCIALGHTADINGIKGKPLTKSTREAYFRRFIQQFRKFFNLSEDCKIEYVRVKELTLSKVEHYHCIMTNVPRRYGERYLRNVASQIWNAITKKSYIVDVRHTYGRPEEYLLKYVTKEVDEEAIEGRLWSFSQGALRPPRVVRNYWIDAYFDPDKSYPPFRRAFGLGAWSQFRRHVDPISRKGEFMQRQACHHEECQLRLWHTPKQVRNFEQSVGYERAMRIYFCEQVEDLKNLFWQGENMEYFNYGSD